MELNTRISGDQLIKLKQDVETYNLKRFGNKKADQKNNEVSKDSFLRLLTSQMSHQDPMNPMQNHEVMAQMAQFSALEQMVNMNKGVGGLNDSITRMQAQNLLGRDVQFADPVTQRVERGTVTRLSFGEDGKTLVQVGAREVKVSDILSVEAPAAFRPSPLRP